MSKIFSKTMNSVPVLRQDLLDKYPPLYIHPRKLYFYDLACNAHKLVPGHMIISRFSFNEQAFDGGFPYKSCTTFSTDPTYYDYKKDVSTEDRFVCYVNFADYNLFGFYDDGKFAQDEIQTTEHPLLGSVVRYLEAKEIPSLEPYTALSENKIPSPYLIENVPYWISVNTSVIMPDGSVHNLYGRNFRTETKEVVNEGVKIVEEEIDDNILAIAAPNEFYNEYYSVTDIRYIIQALLSGFSGAVDQAHKKNCNKIAIHTGNLGCGAFGGNPTLMYLAQFIAGNMSGVDELIFHAPIQERYEEAIQLYDAFIEKVVNGGNEVVRGIVCSMKSIIDFLDSYKFMWGNGNGT